MYTKTSTEFNNLIEQNGGRTFYSKLECSSFSVSSGIKKITYTGGSSAEDGITVGSAVSACIEVVMEKNGHVITGQSISFDLGLEVNGAIEYIPMGIFKANKPEMTDYEITFKAYDRMTQAEKNYVSDLKYPTDTVKVMKEIAQKLGIEFITTIPPIALNNPNTEENSSNAVFAGYTYREAIGYIAGLYGKFAIFNRLGQLEFRWYEDSGFEIPVSKCYSFTKNENNYTINKIIGTAADNTQYEAGSGITGISFSNPFVTQEIVNKIYADIGGFAYRGGETTFLGDCRIDVWDIVTGTDLFGNAYKLPVMEIVHEIDGGLTTTVKSKVSDSESVEDTFKGPATKAMERVHTQLLLVNTLIASKASIEYLEANYIKTDEIDAIEANIENAVITSLQGKFASIEYLETNYAEIDFANVQKESVGTLLAGVGLISSATITDGHVTGFLDAVQVNASNITAGVLDAGNIEVVNLKAASITVGQINGYQIASGAIDMDNLAESITNEIDSARTNAQTALDEALKAFNEAQSASAKAGTAQITADGKNTVYYQNSQPSGGTYKVNDIWFDNDGGNKMYRWNGTSWVGEQFGTGAIGDNKITADKIATEVNTRIDNAFTNAGSALAEANSASTIANNALNAFNNLSIGGRNLLLTSGDYTSGEITKWKAFGSGHWTIQTYDGYVRMLKNDTATLVWVVLLASQVLESGKEYTLSFRFRKSNNSPFNVYIATYNNQSNKTQSVATISNFESNVFVERRVTFNCEVDTANSFMFSSTQFRNSGEYIDFEWIKLESGNQATAWTPAPEDLEEDISFAQTTADAKNKVYYQTYAPSGTYGVNDIWFDTDDSNKMYYWNGSSWIAKQFGTNAIADASITNALIADATIQSAKIANLDAAKITSGYIDAARIKAGTITLGQLSTSVQNTINGAQQQVYHTCSNGAGTSGYFYLAQLKISAAYQNQPIKISALNRSGIPSSVWITFSNANHTDPGIARFAKTGNINFYIVKSAASTWDLYVAKSEAHDRLDIVEFEKGSYTGNSITVTWKNQTVTSLPSGYITAAQTIATAEWCYNNDITYINGGKIYTGTVVAAAIAAGAVTTDKLAANAVTAAKMAVGTITAASGIIANAAIQTANIKDLAVTGAKLADATIGTAKIADAAITNAKIANLSVTNAKIADATIESAKIKALDAAKITTGTLSADRIGANTVTADKIASNAITSVKIAAGAVTAGTIVSGAISTDKLAAGAVTATKIASGAVTAGTIASGAITADKISAGAVTAEKLSVGNGGNLYATGYDTFENIPNVAERIYYLKNSTATVSIDTNTAYYGTRCLKIDSSGVDSYVHLGDSQNGYGCIPVVAGKVYIASAWMKASKTTEAQLWVVGHTAKNNTNSQQSAVTTRVGTSWTRVYMQYTAVLGYPYISIRVDNDTSGSTLWVDAIQIETGTATQAPSEFSPAGTTVINGGRIITGTITAGSIASNAITADKIASNAVTASEIAANAIAAVHISSGAVTAAKIAAGAVTADKINVTSLEAIVAKIGGFTIGSNSIQNGTWGTSGSVMMCTGSNGSKSIAGSPSINGWCFTAGDAFGVTKAGKLYASNANITGYSKFGDWEIKETYIRNEQSLSDGTKRQISIGAPTSTSNPAMVLFKIRTDNAAETLFAVDSGGSVIANSITSYGMIEARGNITSRGSISASGASSATGAMYIHQNSGASNLTLYNNTSRDVQLRLDSTYFYILPHTSSGFDLAHAAYMSPTTGAFSVASLTNRSSLRYKENIKPIFEITADKLMDIKVYSFDYKPKYGDKGMYGVIAEEVENICPFAVSHDNCGRPEGVDYTRFVPLIIKKIQMQERKIQYLENMVTHLIGIAMNPARVKSYQI